MWHWLAKWWRENVDDGIVHDGLHEQDEPCSPGCVPVAEYRARRRALKEANRDRRR